MAERTWEVRELPILEAMAQAQESGADVASAAADAVPELSTDVYLETIASLAGDDFIDAHVQRGGAGQITLAMPARLRPKGRRAVDQWPGGDPGTELLHVIERLEEAEPDPEKKGHFRHLKDAAADAGKDILARIAIELMRAHGGLPRS